LPAHRLCSSSGDRYRQSLLETSYPLDCKQARKSQ